MKKLLLIILFIPLVSYSQWLETGNQKLGYKTGIQMSGRYQYAFNNIGIAGTLGFGVGVCNPSKLPSEVVEMTGTRVVGHDNYGNYMCVADSSIMVYIPKFYYSIITFQTDSNYIEISSLPKTGYVLHRAFIDGGVEKDGFFVDKYKWCLTNDTWNGATQLTGIASSRKGSNPISSNNASKRDSVNGYAGSFSNCKSNSQSPADDYSGGFAVAKSRGNNFMMITAFQQSALAMLSLAQGIKSSDTSVTKWYDATNNFPKGNNNSGKDINDASVTFTACTDNYWKTRNEARLNGGANRLDKTTHNGQMNGVADLNGNQWEIMAGYTYLNSVRWLYKTSVTASAVTYANINDANWKKANCDTTIFITGTATTRFGRTTYRVLSPDASGNGYELTSLGMPSQDSSISTSGSNKFGQDYYYYSTGSALVCSGTWGYGTSAGVWCASLNDLWGNTYRSVSSRSCLYSN